MPFTITATNNNMDVVSFERDTAAGALEKCLELERGGFQSIIVKDDKGLAELRRLDPGGSPLVGRRAELTQCRAVLAAIGEGSSGAVVAVRGEPGIGKTRFVEEMQSVATSLGFERHIGWVLDFGTERGHGAVRTIVGSLLGLARDAPLSDFEVAIAARNRANETADDPLYLRDLLEFPQREEDRPLYEAIDRAARTRAKERVVADLIEERARKRPLLLTVEDIHWADADTLSLLQGIARATTLSRTALIMTTRTGNDPLDAAWRANAGDGLQLTIDLGPLAPAEAQRIAQSFAAAEAFAAQCVQRAGGNPLFLEQLLRTAGDLVDGKLPTTIQSVVLARTDLLAPNDRRAIEAASILGQRLALANLRALIEDPRYACEALLRNALLRPVADGLQFVHALVREGVYASLTRARRRQLHRRAAEILLDDPVLHAEHLDLAEDPEAARAYLVASRDQAALFRLNQATALAVRGLKIATEPRDRLDLALQLGRLQLDAGRGEDALEAFRTALAASNEEKDRLPALIGCAASNRLLAKIDDAFAALSEAEPSARAASDDRALAEIHYIRGNLRFARGEIEECRTAHAAALDVAERLGSPEWRARALSGLADAQYMDCRMATALGHFSECVELCDAAGLTRIAVPNRVMMSACRGYLFEFDASLDDARLALESARRIANSHGEMFALHSIGYSLTLMGRYGEASEAQSAALERARSLKARRFEAAILAVCAELALVEGRPAEARSLVREGLAASEETSPGFVGPVLFGLSALTEPTPEAQEAALAAGESLLAERGHRRQSHPVPPLRDRTRLARPRLGRGGAALRGAAPANGARAAALGNPYCPARTAPRSDRPGRRQRERRSQAFRVALKRGGGWTADRRIGRGVATIDARSRSSPPSIDPIQRPFRRISPVAPTAAFSPFPPVQRAHLERVLRVVLTRSPSRRGMPASCAERTAGVDETGHSSAPCPSAQATQSDPLATRLELRWRPNASDNSGFRDRLVGRPPKPRSPSDCR